MGPSLDIDVSSILGEAGATLEVDADVPLSSICVADVRVEFVHPPQLHAIIANVGDVLLLSGSVNATATLECSRCLGLFEYPLTGMLDAVVSEIDDLATRNDDQEWYRLQGETVDLMPAAESALRVEIPFAPLHNEECKGICPTCGCDLNRDECACHPAAATQADNPFAPLKDLLGQETE